MNVKKRLIYFGIISIFVYGIVVSFFALNFLGLSKSISGIEENYLRDVETRIRASFKNSSTIAIELEKLRESNPFEIVVKKGGEVIYSSIPLSDGQLSGTLHPDVVALEVKGQISRDDATYDVWYAVYRIPLEAYVSQFFNAQNVLIVLSTIVLVLLVIALHTILLKPLYRIRKSIKKMENYQFDEVEQGDDVINHQLSLFASKMDQSIKAVSRKHTELEMQLQTSKERLHNTLIVSRGLVHDLKSPIHQLLLENEMMMDELGTPEVLYMGKYNVNAIDGFIKSVNSILALLAQDQYGVEFKMEPFNLSQLVSQSVRQFGPRIHAKDLGLDLEVPEEGEVVYSQVSMILLVNNLLSNMVQYALEGSELGFALSIVQNRIVVQTKNMSSMSDLERMQNSEQLFNIVVEEESKDHVYSSGNGLFLIKDLVKIMNGNYDYEVKEQVITITITLPLNNET